MPLPTKAGFKTLKERGITAKAIDIFCLIDDERQSDHLTSSVMFFFAVASIRRMRLSWLTNDRLGS